MVRLAAALVGLALAACSPNGTSAQEANPAPAPVAENSDYSEAGLRLIDVTIVSGDTRHLFTTELAASQEEQAKGMMFRNEMGDDEGMLFPSYSPQFRSFWMKNTPLPLDIIFIGPNKRITNIEAGVPYSLESVTSRGMSIAVFEIRGGLSEELGIAPGDLVEFEIPEDAGL
ncbi:DUF192 domain-containing protein [Qipengyuania sp. S6317L1]|uniref:DUF192 domain-containing protein n=1 Tax=Qipengyuania sp. S6317L1 TaxID=2926410 RepID=UPI001FF696C3|nr:DUF192 domain-containing protein [Qipengyuania sp. S6317L1]MCK0097941.1 DUF192 domain-containing protein [Qipengyuania sp. S6317L1]